VARFAVKGAFSLTGRGFILAGDIVDGTLRKGMRLQYVGAFQRMAFEIAGVEFIDHIGERRAEIGLLLPLPAIRDAGVDDPDCWVGKEYDCVEGSLALCDPPSGCAK
jgi:hypothetical protein